MLVIPIEKGQWCLTISRQMPERKGSLLQRSQKVSEPWAFLDVYRLFEKVDLNLGRRMLPGS